MRLAAKKARLSLKVFFLIIFNLIESFAFFTSLDVPVLVELSRNNCFLYVLKRFLVLMVVF
jgi:hypothetical protein